MKLHLCRPFGPQPCCFRRLHHRPCIDTLVVRTGHLQPSGSSSTALSIVAAFLISYLARMVLATSLRAFVPSCPRVWQTRHDVSSSTVRQHQLFGVIFLNDCHERITVIIFSTAF
uniref:Uncharacterized protein n=1 Tax=Oryza rufipogon TaxID=4529 RepID=A0A0E0Q724_ORYRU